MTFPTMTQPGLSPDSYDPGSRLCRCYFGVAAGVEALSSYVDMTLRTPADGR